MTTTFDEIEIHNLNAEMRRRFAEDEKKNEQETARRRAEWEATPDSERNCTHCGLRLSLVDVARITETLPALRHHDFCNPFNPELNSGVAKGLVRLLREQAYGDEPIPLETVKKLFEVWRGQKGRCWISQIQMSFLGKTREASEPTEPQKRPSSVDPLIWARMQREQQAEWAQSARNAEIHSPVIVMDGDNIRLISKTVQSWRQNLSDAEFVGLLRTLYSRLPDLERKQVLDYRTSAARFSRSHDSRL